MVWTSCSGLIFVAYSRSITNAFQFIDACVLMRLLRIIYASLQLGDITVLVDKDPIVPGFDPIIGQNGVEGIRVRLMTCLHLYDMGTLFLLLAD